MDKLLYLIDKLGLFRGLAIITPIFFLINTPILLTTFVKKFENVEWMFWSSFALDILGAVFVISTIIYYYVRDTKAQKAARASASKK